MRLLKTARAATLIAAMGMIAAAGESAARADTVIFDFEAQPAAIGLTSLSISRPGLTISVTRPGAVFGVDALASYPFAGVPASFGQNSLSPAGNTASPAPFVATFSVPVTRVSIDMGDASSDVDVLLLEAFSGANATGTLLGSVTTTLTPSASPATFTFSTLGLTIPGINSVRFSGGLASGSVNRNSVFYDNLTAEPVPEPATMILMGSGLLSLGAGAARRRRQRKV